MKIEQIDTDEIVGLKCPKTGNRILWDDEYIEDALRGTVVSAVVTSLCPDECSIWMPLAAAWATHFKNANTRKLTLNEVIEAFPAPGKAVKVVSSGIACGLVSDVTYFIVPEELPDGCFIRAEFEDDTEANANAER